MATRTTNIPALSGSELETLLGGADSVELKATVPTGEQQRAFAAIGLDPLDAQIRQVYFFDTPDLRLNKAGVVVRARRIQGRSGDTVVKLRPVVPDELPADVRKLVTVEVDAMPGGYVCSASMKGAAPNKKVREAVAGKRSLRKLFSKEQRAFLTAHAPDGPDLDDLTILGPVFVLKDIVEPAALKRRVVVEMWLLPDGTRIVELSTKCPPRKAHKVAAEARAYLTGIGLTLEPDPHTKTKSALEFFAGNA